MLRIPHHPLRMARFGLTAIRIRAKFCAKPFRNPRTRAVFAGLAGHSCLSFDRPLSATIGLMFGITIHAVGWPIPRGGAGAITQALAGYLNTLGGTVHTSHRIDSGRLQRDGSGERSDLLRHRAATVACDCRRAAGARLQAKAGAISARAGRIQDRLRSFRAGSLAGGGVPARNHRAPGRHVRGDRRGRRRGGARARSRAALRAGRAAYALRSNARAGRQDMCCGRIATCPTGRHST